MGRYDNEDIIKPKLPHKCEPPCVCYSCEQGTYVLDGDLWECPECNKWWYAKTLYMRAGCPTVWDRPSAWKLHKLMRRAGL